MSLRTDRKICSRLDLQRGMSLVEVLVALVVVSIGLLGVAALQVNTLQNNHTSLIRTQASALADDIIDRMRANRNSAINGDYNITMGTPASGSIPAKIDLIAWQNSLTSLPGSQGQVDVDAATNRATVTIGWSEQGTGFVTFTTITVI